MYCVCVCVCVCVDGDAGLFQMSLAARNNSKVILICVLPCIDNVDGFSLITGSSGATCFVVGVRVCVCFGRYRGGYDVMMEDFFPLFFVFFEL